MAESDAERQKREATTRREAEESLAEGRSGNQRQTVRLMPDDQPDVGPYYPSGMSAPEAAVAGATADMDEETVSRLAELSGGGEDTAARRQQAKAVTSGKRDSE